MSEENEMLNSFMTNKNKEALGEKIEGQINSDDNFLDEGQKAMNTFKGEAPVNSNDKTLMVAKQAMNTLIAIPILIGGIVSVFYVLMTIGPSILSFLRRIAIGLFI